MKKYLMNLNENLLNLKRRKINNRNNCKFTISLNFVLRLRKGYFCVTLFINSAKEKINTKDRKKKN